MAARVGKYELVVCELLVENILVNMEPEEVAALLSFLVCRSSNSDHYPTSFKTLTPSLQEVSKSQVVLVTLCINILFLIHVFRDLIFKGFPI